MRLLDLHKCDLRVGKLTMIDTGGSAPPPYAILSHTWENEEILFADVERGDPRSKAGYAKVKGAIRQALRDGYAYLWDDTCCIAKSSSAELSEAINSMYRWYQGASRCYGYLSDVSVEPDDQALLSRQRRLLCGSRNGFPEGSLDTSRVGEQFRASRWFTRGWTLQELVAPVIVRFFDKHWNLIGSKFELQHLVSSITSIPSAVLTNSQLIDTVSVARRMSWASARRTTRIEDIAYCLMGMFSVNMPLLYGEGEGAFIRLQEEILRSSDDYTIFAWKTSPVRGHGIIPELHGLLADHPSAFRDTGNALPYQWNNEPCSMTNKGLRLSLGVWRSMAILPCTPSADSPELLAVEITEVPGGFQQYARANTAALRVCNTSGQLQSMYFPQVPPKLEKVPIPLRTLRLCMGHQDAALSKMIPIDASGAGERGEDIGGAGQRFKHAATNQRAIRTLADRLAGGEVSDAFHMYTWNPGPWLTILFRRQFDELSKRMSYFKLRLGINADGKIGFCIQALDYEEKQPKSDATDRLQPENQSQRTVTGMETTATQEMPTSTELFYPVAVGEKSAVPIKSILPAWGHLRRRSETVLQSDLVSVVLRERPSRHTEGNQLDLAETEDVLEIVIDTSPL